MIDLDKLKFHTAARDSQGHPVLLPKPRLHEFEKADAVSRRHYYIAADREAQEVAAAARQAAMPAKPANWDKCSEVDRLAWVYAAQKDF